MHVHSGASFPIHRLGHQSSGFSVLQGSIADDILNHHGRICHKRHFAKLRLNLILTSRANFRMMIFNGDTRLLHQHAHFAAAFVGRIEGLGNMIILLLRNNNTLSLDSGIPMGLINIQLHGNMLRLYFPAHLIKQVEFKLRQNQHGIRDSRLLHIFFRSHNNISGILLKGPVLGMIDNHGISGHGKSGNFAERIHHGRIQVRNEYHITFLNHGIAIIGSVKTNTVLHNLFIEGLGGNCHMTELAVDIHHLKINHADFLLPNQRNNVLSSFHIRTSPLQI